ncbi:hypothetical protein [Kineosporia succinea]|uniref:Uncharacterized protein n=1 Tax=Kineosporia succinea TaxID=84632 RepID=A0ABT9P8B1_9ACTN|nr:hypothetical protein [Kineosporia succinea]MDP9828940.1 hypothetical protein [Kineosporia succinea]
MVVRGAGRVLGGVVDVVHDRAPAVSERAYRAVAAPLLLADPQGSAQAVQTRLDGTRDRVSALATRGTVPSSAARRVRRDLARTRADVDLLAPRLPVVQARCLVQRSAAYDDALRSLSHQAAQRTGAQLARDTAVVAGSLGGWIGVLVLLGAGVIAASLIGLVAGAVTASLVLGAATRRTGRERLGAIASALAHADVVAVGATSAVPGLDQRRRALVERAAGRLDQRGLTALRAIDTHLDDLLVRLMEGELEADGMHLVQASVERYLPDTLEPFLSLKDVNSPVQGRSAQAEVADQLVSIETALADLARRPSRSNLEQQLLRQGEFLRSKFGATPGN